jgi:hypothetical protein
MLKNDNEGNFKIKFYAENRKEWKILGIDESKKITILCIS